MKKYILSFFLFLGLVSFATAQELSYGLTGGVNYTTSGPITGNSSGVGNFSGTVEDEGGIGFRGGIFAQVNFGNFFVRPEVIYASLETEYPFPAQPATYSIERFTVPLLVGYNIFGPVDVYAGPVYSNILNATLEGEQVLNPIVVQSSPVNAQVGVKAEFGRFGIDIRYEHSLSSVGGLLLDVDEANYGINLATFEDSTLDVIMVSLILKLGGPGLNTGRGRPCY